MKEHDTRALFKAYLYAKGLTIREALPMLFEPSWDNQTAALPFADDWSRDNAALGQCDATALVVRDLVGGEVLLHTIPGFGYHFSNCSEDKNEYDLTRSGLPEGTELPPGEAISVQRLIGSPRAKAMHVEARYRLLLHRVRRRLREPLPTGID